jgi:hypothetical protein
MAVEKDKIEELLRQEDGSAFLAFGTVVTLARQTTM